MEALEPSHREPEAVEVHTMEEGVKSDGDKHNGETVNERVDNDDVVERENHQGQTVVQEKSGDNVSDGESVVQGEKKSRTHVGVCVDVCGDILEDMEGEDGLSDVSDFASHIGEETNLYTLQEVNECRGDGLLFPEAQHFKSKIM